MPHSHTTIACCVAPFNSMGEFDQQHRSLVKNDAAVWDARRRWGLYCISFGPVQNWNISGKKCIASHKNVLITTPRRTLPSVFYMFRTFLGKHTKKLILRHLINAARLSIALFWRDSHPPSIPQWLRKVEELNNMENMVISTQNKDEACSKTWIHWDTFVFSEEGEALFGSCAQWNNEPLCPLLAYYTHRLPTPSTQFIFLLSLPFYPAEWLNQQAPATSHGGREIGHIPNSPYTKVLDIFLHSKNMHKAAESKVKASMYCWRGHQLSTWFVLHDSNTSSL